MPAPYAHIMISHEALKKLKESIPANLAGCALDHFVLLGCAAPDYPYLDKGDSPQKIWADHMHYDLTGDIQKAMADRLIELAQGGFQTDKFKILFSWTLGYLSHVIADCVIHPVVMGVVGSYSGHEKEHQYCEMVQDSYIYNKLTGKEIDHSDLIESLRKCSDPQNPRAIHPYVSGYWGALLKTLFPPDYRNVEPEIDEWHRKYITILDEDGAIQCIGRVLGQTYLESTEIPNPDRMKYITHLRLPDDTHSIYDVPFARAVNTVVGRWSVLARALSVNDIIDFASQVVNCNLDTGYEMTRLAHW